MTCKDYMRYQLWLLILTAAVSVPSLSAAEIFLRADTTIKTMPDGRLILMWGFAQDSAFEAHDGTVTVPGPQIVLDPSDTALTIHLENNLPEPVSIMIGGQIAAVNPVSFVDEQGRQRIRSFTHETPSDNAAPVDYVWSNLRPGTFLYQSASHPALQVQMGLYGCMKRNAAGNEVYAGVAYDQEITLLFSEIDPGLHDAVWADDYGPGKSVTSTMDYTPRYFLINGEAYAPGQLPLAAGEVNDRVLLRLINAGIEGHVPCLQGLRGKVLAEDGYPYTYPQDQYTIDLPPAKTKDVLVTPSAAGTYPLYDHRFRLSNDTATPGGMLAFLKVEETAPAPLGIPAGMAALTGDIDKDGDIDTTDLRLFVDYFRQGRSRANNPADLNGDGKLNGNDKMIMVQAYFEVYREKQKAVRSQQTVKRPAVPTVKKPAVSAKRR